jgi:hypothetical protein
VSELVSPIGGATDGSENPSTSLYKRPASVAYSRLQALGEGTLGGICSNAISFDRSVVRPGPFISK